MPQITMQSYNNPLDVIVEPRYDTNTILAAGTLSLSYFTVPVGQGLSAFAGAGVAKSYSDTNTDQIQLHESPDYDPEFDPAFNPDDDDDLDDDDLDDDEFEEYEDDGDDDDDDDNDEFN